jgi:hypothetical protein
MGLLFKLAEEWLTKAQIELKHTLTVGAMIGSYWYSRVLCEFLQAPELFTCHQH